MIEIIERTNYLDKLKALQNKSVIKVFILFGLIIN